MALSNIFLNLNVPSKYIFGNMRYNGNKVTAQTPSTTASFNPIPVIITLDH